MGGLKSEKQGLKGGTPPFRGWALGKRPKEISFREKVGI